MSIELAKASLELANDINLDNDEDPTGRIRELLYLDSIAESLVSIASALNYANNRKDI
jgi:hypothetical protein